MKWRTFGLSLALLLGLTVTASAQTRGRVGTTASDQALKKLISPRGFTRWPPFPSDPHDCTLFEQGDFYVNTTTAMLRYCDGTDWRDVAADGAGGAVAGSFVEDFETTGTITGSFNLTFPTGNETDVDGWKQVDDLTFTVPAGEDGDYIISSNISTTGSTGETVAGIAVNGTLVSEDSDDRGGAASPRMTSVSVVTALVAGDTVTFPGSVSTGTGTVVRFRMGIVRGSSVAGGTGIDGSGTIDTVPKFTAATTLGDSNITDDGSKVTITGTATNLFDPAVTFSGTTASLPFPGALIDGVFNFEATMEAMTGSLSARGVRIEITNAAHTGSGNILDALEFTSLQGGNSGNAQENAISIQGTGSAALRYDNWLKVGSTNTAAFLFPIPALTVDRTFTYGDDNINFTSPSDNDVLTYDLASRTWSPEVIATVSTFNDLTVQGAALGNPATGDVRVYVRDDIDQGAGTGAADCASVVRLSSGTEVLDLILVTDGACP